MAKVNVLNTVSYHRRRRSGEAFGATAAARPNSSLPRRSLSVYRYRVTHAASVNINIQRKKIHGFYVCFGGAMEGK